MILYKVVSTTVDGLRLDSLEVQGALTARSQFRG